MKEYKAKSAIIGKKGKMDENENYPVFVNLFNKNNPHKDVSAAPVEFVEFDAVHKIIIKDLTVEYLLVGKDMVINNLDSITLDLVEDGHLIISGKQI